MAFWVLALETSGPQGSVALWDAETRTGAQEALPHAFRHAEDLPGRIQSLLSRFHVGFPQISLVSVVRGPGYFTALRVGIAYAKALWLAHQVPVVAPTSLEVLAYSLARPSQRVVPVINAQRGQVYYAVYLNRRLEAGPAVARPEDLAPQYPDALFVGPGLRVFPKGLSVSRGPDVYPPAQAVAQHGWELYQTQGPVDAVTLDPLYIRDPDAVRRRRGADH